MSKIDPTVGRVVWFHPAGNSSHPAFEPNAICSGQIAKVLPNGRLNLGVLDGNGASHSMTDVPLIQEDDTAPEDGYYAEWMPYQRGQAAKTEAVEQQLSSTNSLLPAPKVGALSAPVVDPSPFSAAADPVVVEPAT